MNDSLIVLAMALVIVGVGIVVAVVRKGSGAPAPTVGDSVTLAFEKAQIFALAADQLSELGKLPKEERFTYVANILATLYPHLPTEFIEPAIEGAVKRLKLDGRPVSLVLPAPIEHD